jgi:hypothetical protein
MFFFNEKRLKYLLRTCGICNFFYDERSIYLFMLEVPGMCLSKEVYTPIPQRYTYMLEVPSMCFVTTGLYLTS